MIKIRRVSSILILISAILLVCVSNETYAKENKGIKIDKTFGDCAYWLKSKQYDKNKDGYLSSREIKKIRKLCCHGNWGNVINLKGISKLKSLEKLDLYAKQLTSMNEIGKLRKLETLKIEVHKKNKTNIKISSKNNIKNLNLKNVNGGMEAVSKCPKIEKLRIEGDQTSKSLVIKNNRYIKTISLYSKMDALEKITVQSCKNLKELGIYTKSGAKLNNLKRIELLNNKKMKYIDVGSHCPNVSKLTVQNLSELRGLYVEKNNFIENLRLENVPKLKTIIWENGKLRNLEIIGKNSLSTMEISNNNFEKFEYPELKNLSELNIKNNKLHGAFNVDNYPKVYEFNLNNNNLTMIYGMEEKKNLRGFYCNENKNLKLVYLPNYYFWYFDCTVPYVKIYVCCEEEWVDDTAERHIAWWLKDYTE